MTNLLDFIRGLAKDDTQGAMCSEVRALTWSYIIIIIVANSIVILLLLL